MAAFTMTSQVETIVGKLTNGRKIVLKEIVIADAGTAQDVTIKSLQRIIGWTLGLGTPTTMTFICADHATQLNAINVSPSGNATGCRLQILAVGV